MYCPMKFNGENFVNTQLQDEQWDCDRDNCAFWNNDLIECSIKSIAKCFNYMLEHGLNINNNY